MTNRLLAAAALALVTACGSGGSSNSGHVCRDANTTPDPELLEDYSVNFTGDWYLSLTVSAGGYTEEDAGVATVSRADVNKLDVPSCVERNPALVVDASTFDTVCFVCPTISVTGCSSVVVTLPTGQGVLDEMTGDLSIAYRGTMNVCGEVYDLTMTFEGSRLGAVAATAMDALEAAPPIDGVLGRLGSALAR